MPPTYFSTPFDCCEKDDASDCSANPIDDRGKLTVLNDSFSLAHEPIFWLAQTKRVVLVSKTSLKQVYLLNLFKYFNSACVRF